jgi:GT2 family glycosyltransferase
MTEDVLEVAEVGLRPAPSRSGTGRRLSASVVICAYTERRWDDLCAAVDSVRAQTVAPDEIVVIVDHNDALARRAAHHLRGVSVVAAEGAPGLSGARNMGVTVSTGDVVLFLDDDARACPEWIERTLGAFADPDVIGVAGLVLPRWDPPGRPSWFPDALLWVVGCSYEGLPTATAPVRNPIGAVMAFRRGAFLLAGGFRCDLGRSGSRPAGCEETEFSLRLRLASPRSVIVLEPAARAEHRVSAERMRWAYLLTRCWHEGRSKRAVSRMAGRGAALESERAYVARVLPAAVAQGLWATARTGDPAGLLRAVAVLAGLTAAATGYLAQLVGDRSPITGRGARRERPGRGRER